jgi:DNA invertase Pin-like site-specific DNA recombinase
MILSLSSLLVKLKRRVILYCRVSDKDQEDHLPRQIDYCTKELTRLGFTVVKVFFEVACGRNWDRKLRKEFYKAREMAKEMGLPIVVHSLPRLIRERKKSDSGIHPDDHAILRHDSITYITILPSDTPFGEVMKMEGALGILYALADPESKLSKYHEKRRHAKKYGTYVRGEFGGAPKKEVTPQVRKVLSLHEQGYSLGQIEVFTDVKKSTVRDWIKRYGPKSCG